MVGEAPADGVLARGQAFTDGALRGSIPKAHRAGGAYIVDDGIGGLSGAHGTCAQACTSVLRVELHAVTQVLRITACDLTLHVNNKMLVDGVARGRAWPCESRREAADLWRALWDRLDELPDTVRIVKVKAHLRVQDAQSGKTHWSRPRAMGEGESVVSLDNAVSC